MKTDRTRPKKENEDKRGNMNHRICRISEHNESKQRSKTQQRNQGDQIDMEDGLSGQTKQDIRSGLDQNQTRQKGADNIRNYPV